MEHNERKEQILKAALTVAENVGYNKMSRREVAAEANVSESLVQYHFNEISLLRRKTLERAFDTENVTIATQALGLGHPVPLKIKARILETMK